MKWNENGVDKKRKLKWKYHKTGKQTTENPLLIGIEYAKRIIKSVKTDAPSTLGMGTGTADTRSG